MKKTFLVLLISLCSLGMMAEDFKVGDAKYKVLPDGTVELKEYKKATGDVVIPGEVSNPKTGKSYTVSAIGREAFCKAPLTSIELPNTVTTIGSRAFAECPKLVSAKLPEDLAEIPDRCFVNSPALKNLDVNFESLGNVGVYAFSGTDMGEVAPLYRMFSGSSVRTVYCIYPKGQTVGSSFPLVIAPGVNMAGVDFTTITGPNPIIVFADPNAGQQAVDVFETVANKLIPRSPNGYDPWSLLGEAIDSYRDAESSTFRDEYFFSYPEVGLYLFGAEETDEGLNLLHDTPYRLLQAAEVAAENRNRQKFLAKMSDFVETAIDDPQNLDRCYYKIEPWEAVKYVSDFRNAVYAVCDSVYLIKPELSEKEAYNLGCFVNNCVNFIMADYGFENAGLDAWAKKDILNKDLESGKHKDDYERIIKQNERLLKVSNTPQPYRQSLQLAALCALERWKEAAAYFPKVHRVVTDNGFWAVPYELDYMKDEINKRGFKAVAPNYSKGKQIKSSDPGLIDFFVTEAIEAGVRHYEKKRAERKAREFFYESIGLDKKGRPKK